MISLNEFLLEKYYSQLKDLKNLSFLDLSIEKSNYSQSFFEEYKKFPKIQLDSFNKLSLNANRLFKNSRWLKKELINKKILEIGSGSGKFTEVLLNTKCNLITTDINDSILINYKNNYNKNFLNKVFFIKCDVNQIIFKDEIFDYIVLYGVLQNVSEQKNIIKDSIIKLKKGGKITIDVTKASRFGLHILNPKYFWRNLFKRISPNKTFSFVNYTVPKFIKIDTLLKKKFGFFGRIISKILFPFPLINYYFLPLSDEIKLKLSILDTFDALASKYDNPLTKKKLKKLINKIEKELKMKFEKVDIFEKDNLIIANIVR